MSCAKCGAETDSFLCLQCREKLQGRSREADNLAETYHLGKVIVQYAVKATTSNASILFYGSMALLLLAIGTGVVVYTLITHPRGQGNILALVLAAGVVGGGYLAWKIRLLLTNRHVRVVICDDGFLYVNGRRTEVFRWDQLEAVEHKHREYSSGRPGAQRTKKDSYFVWRKDGVKVRYDDDLWDNLLRLGQRIESRAAQYNVPIRLNTNS